MKIVKKCPECNGSGVKYIYNERVEGKFIIEECPKCKGKGFVVVDVKKLVKI